MTSHMMSKGSNVSLERVIGDRHDLVVVIETVSDGELIAPDASVLLVDDQGRVRSNDDLVFYNQPVGADGAVRLLRLGDDVTDDRIRRDAVEVELHGLPEGIARIVIAASIDIDASVPFGHAASVRMWLATSSTPLEPAATFEITDLGDERALIFSELYRRGTEWKLRAVGQGYREGLAQLVVDFGIEVDDTVEAPIDENQLVEHSTHAPPDADQPDERTSRSVGADAAGSEEPAPKVAINRRRRPARLAPDWAQRVSPYLPVLEMPPWPRARLFPVVGIKTAMDQEMRATSALLSVVEIVRELGRALIRSVDGPGGRIETFTEVRFSHAGDDLRPDGLIRVTRGTKAWHALVEVKTGKALLEHDQIEKYLSLAKAKGFNAVLVISGQLLATTAERPVSIDARKHRAVALKSLSWEEIITEAAVVHTHVGIEDRTQARVMDEFLRYACDGQSGMATFDDMGRYWVKVRDAVKVKTISPNDAATHDVCRKFDQLIRHIALQQTALTGQRVTSMAPANHPDAVSRAKQLADSGELFGTLRVPGAPGQIVLNANLGTERIGCSMTTTAPRGNRAATKVAWLTRQLTEAPDAIRISAHHAGSRSEMTSALLGAIRAGSTSILPPSGRDIRAFTITLETSMGSKRAGSEGGFVTAMTKLANTFYAEIVHVVRDGRQ